MRSHFHLRVLKGDFEGLQTKKKKRRRRRRKTRKEGMGLKRMRIQG
jgi:hypothetical protein